MLPVAVGGAWKRLMTQTGTCAARSGSGGPKVAPLSDRAPIGPVAVQFGFVLVSHPLMQRKSFEFGVTGKLCEIPLQPLSRSVHLSATVRTASSGPPWGFFGQPGIVVVVVPHPVLAGFGRQRRTSLSTSFLGLALLAVAMIRNAIFPVRFCLLPLSGTVTVAASPQTWVAPPVVAGGLMVTGPLMITLVRLWGVHAAPTVADSSIHSFTLKVHELLHAIMSARTGLDAAPSAWVTPSTSAPT